MHAPLSYLRLHIHRALWRILLLCLPIQLFAAEQILTSAELSVWVNEAIVATYTYDYAHFIEQQKAIAKYFTASGWTNYANALNDAKLPETVQKNAYYVSAVATNPPKITARDDAHWQAEMPVLVVYENPQYQQKQTLMVTIAFERTSSSNLGVRGLAISSLNAKTLKPACQCDIQNTQG